ncbi:MAG: thioredoxin family protein [Flavobacteriaceae bacterium]|nr:thioredoxin family protein [Flavobacteriaceae bacterium]
MKKLNIIVFLLLIGVTLQAQEKKGIQFFKGSFEEALKEAKKQNKPLFVDFYAVWCGPCKRMEKTVFTQEKVGDYFNEKFISLQLDAEKPDNIPVAKQYKVEAFPTVVFMDKNGKAISVNTGGMTAEDILEVAKVAVGEAIGFSELYDMYKEDKKNLEIQQQMLLQAPRFLAAQEGMNAEKWVVRVSKLYRSYIKAKKGKDLINKQDYIIISSLTGDDEEQEEEIIKFLNDNLDEWKKVVGNAVCYYILEKNDAKMEALAKEGDLDYKKFLKKINGEFKNAYDVLAYKEITPYEKASKYYDALYSIYEDKDVEKFMSLMTPYFEKLGKDATPNDYGKAAQDLYYAAGDKLEAKHHEKAIAWVQMALKENTDIMNRINYLVMIGDSYREMKKYNMSEKYYNQAYAESLQMTKTEMLQKMVQATIMRKRATLQLLKN